MSADSVLLYSTQSVGMMLIIFMLSPRCGERMRDANFLTLTTVKEINFALNLQSYLIGIIQHMEFVLLASTLVFAKV